MQVQGGLQTFRFGGGGDSMFAGLDSGLEKWGRSLVHRWRVGWVCTWGEGARLGPRPGGQVE